MELLIYLFAAAFVFMAAALMITYRRTRYYGAFLLGLAYAAAAILAVVLTHWWPLVAGFALVWVLRFLGLDPDVKKTGNNEGEQTAKE
ncbi:MAG: hypothetical protein JWN94_1004 [Betaproteobacteria bacterium]|nr:hypothetical protein [Betaproteobacteria bacterium]